jgi:PRTRC genetic system ThiF family protein
MNLVFDPHVNNPRIVVIGVGGTGANVARAVARIAYDMKLRSMTVPKILLIDPDTVEEHNVGRQLFGPQDIGRSKAEVVATRLNYTLGLDIAFVAQRVSREHLKSSNQIIISCVDNHEPREVIHDAFASSSYYGNVLIGAGNYKDGGQVCIGNVTDRMVVLKEIEDKSDRKRELLEQKFLRILPTEGALFPAMLQPDPEPKRNKKNLSCAELLALGEQHLLINDLMATVAAGYVYKMLHREPIKTFLTFVNLEYMSMRSLPISRAEIEPYLKPQEAA